jgi:hypothetical protein
MKKTIKIQATFTDFSFESNWVSGKVGEYIFEAKLFDYGSEFGINKGRVSKLAIYPIGKSFSGAIINYDRGWDIKPNKISKPYYDAVMILCESSPARFELTEHQN